MNNEKIILKYLKMRHCLTARAVVSKANKEMRPGLYTNLFAKRLSGVKYFGNASIDDFKKIDGVHVDELERDILVLLDKGLIVTDVSEFGDVSYRISGAGQTYLEYWLIKHRDEIIVSLDGMLIVWMVGVFQSWHLIDFEFWRIIGTYIVNYALPVLKVMFRVLIWATMG